LAGWPIENPGLYFGLVAKAAEFVQLVSGTQGLGVGDYGESFCSKGPEKTFVQIYDYKLT
jgi:hypothetical protein